MLNPAKDEIIFLPRAKIVDIVRGKGKLVGSRLDPNLPRGVFSPIEPKIYAGQSLSSSQAILDLERQLIKDAKTLKVILTTVYSRLLFQSTHYPKSSAILFGVRIFSGDLHSFIKWLDTPNSNHYRHISFANANNLNQCLLKPKLRRCFQKSHIVLPDGVGLRIAARLSKFGLHSNLNGTDLFPHLCTFATERNISVLLIGGQPGVAEACMENTQTNHPDLVIQTLSNGFELNKRKIANLIKDTSSAQNRSIVLIGLGTPLQEYWVNELLDEYKLEHADFFTVGGLFDHYSNNTSRAPVSWQSAGLEWLWRICQEPRRLFFRYALGIPFFLGSVVSYHFYAKTSRWFNRK